MNSRRVYYANHGWGGMGIDGVVGRGGLGVGFGQGKIHYRAGLRNSTTKTLKADSRNASMGVLRKCAKLRCHRVVSIGAKMMKNSVAVETAAIFITSALR